MVSSRNVWEGGPESTPPSPSLLYMIGRAAVILYLVSLLLITFVPCNIVYMILIIGTITVLYTLLGGMEAVIWTDVMQSAIMIVGIIFCGGLLTYQIFSGSPAPIETALDANKFSLGSLKMTLSERTVWVMIIYGVTENLRNLMADQNYVQKYVSVPTEKEATRSVWIAMLIYIPLTAIFLYIGTGLFAFYNSGGAALPADISKGDQVFPYYITTQLPVVLKGLIVAAIVAAAMSTVDSALNCSATVALIDFQKRFFKPNISEKQSIFFLRAMTVLWGLMGTVGALFMIKAQSALDTWWQISGIFGGGILGLFLLSLFRIRLKFWQGIVAIVFSVVTIAWATFARKLPEALKWAECSIDEIIIGAVGTAVLLIVALLLYFVGGSAPEASDAEGGNA